MGGQACVFYGAAEFSRDSDFAILAEAENLDRLRGALTELRAGVIAVPPFDVAYLEKGHAVHFRCRHPECDGLRVDVISVMRGVDPFELIWQRRATIELPDGTVCDLLSIADLVRAKKTQRDKDWPMIRRLLEADFFNNQDQLPDPARVLFWLRELRTPELLVSLCNDFRELANWLHFEKRGENDDRTVLWIRKTGDRTPVNLFELQKKTPESIAIPPAEEDVGHDKSGPKFEGYHRVTLFLLVTIGVLVGVVIGLVVGFQLQSIKRFDKKIGGSSDLIPRESLTVIGAF